MATRTIKTRLQLRKDLESNYDSSFVPLKGEVLLVDTTSDGLRSKVGDGVKTFAQLPYSDQVVRDLVSGIVVKGYYFGGHFYANEEHTVKIMPYSYKVYINITDMTIYGYFDDEAKYHQLSEIPTASSTVAGIMKIYDEPGNNTDGTMTQKSITSEISKKFVVKAGSDEDLIFTSGITL